MGASDEELGFNADVQTTEGTPAGTPATGQRAAALKRCKHLAKKKDWSHKRLRKCKTKANLLPV